MTDRIYKIHNGNEKIFTVKIHKNSGFETVFVYKKNCRKHILKYIPEKIFIGNCEQYLDISDNMSDGSSSHSPSHSPVTLHTHPTDECFSKHSIEGNAILLKISDNKYVCLGSEIFMFSAESEIIKFVSVVGANDKAYSYAVDYKDNCYILNEHVVIKNISKHISAHDDPYDYYYSKIEFSDSLGKFYINDKQYKIIYHNNVSDYYDYLTMSPFVPRIDDSDDVVLPRKIHFAVDKMGLFEEISKNDFIDIINKFAVDNDFCCMEDVYVIHK